MMSFAIALHALSAVVWIGGMFLVYVCLRPAAGALETPRRLSLFEDVLRRFFVWVWCAVVLLPVTGFWMAFSIFGPVAAWPHYIHIMMGLGIVMILLYLHLYFAPWRRLRRALADGDLPEAGRRLGQIRRIVAVNLGLGVLIVVVASGGRLFAG
jgi:uncharacterized membrane protein